MFDPTTQQDLIATQPHIPAFRQDWGTATCELCGGQIRETEVAVTVPAFATTLNVCRVCALKNRWFVVADRENPCLCAGYHA